MNNLEIFSVTEIMDNFASALDSIWSHTIKVDLVCYDPWEEFYESMFEHLVSKVIADKYEVLLAQDKIATKSLLRTSKPIIKARRGSEIFVFIVFGYPEVDLAGDENQYFGPERPLENIEDMKFSHALCQAEDGKELWIERMELEYYFEACS